MDSTDDEKEDGGNERTGCGGTVPPPYAEISSSFGLLDNAAEEGGNDNAAFLPPAEGQDGVHRYACVQASAAGGKALFF